MQNIKAFKQSFKNNTSLHLELTPQTLMRQENYSQKIYHFMDASVFKSK